MHIYGFKEGNSTQDAFEIVKIN